MADEDMAAPTLTRLLKTEARDDGDGEIIAYFVATDGIGYKLGFHSGMIAYLVTELTARLTELQPVGADVVHTAMLRARAMRLAVGADGNPALLMTMDGYELAMLLDKPAARSLHETLGQFLSAH